jgi:hypothetical protein
VYGVSSHSEGSDEGSTDLAEDQALQPRRAMRITDTSKRAVANTRRLGLDSVKSTREVLHFLDPLQRHDALSCIAMFWERKKRSPQCMREKEENEPGMSKEDVSTKLMMQSTWRIAWRIGCPGVWVGD